MRFLIYPFLFLEEALVDDVSMSMVVQKPWVIGVVGSGFIVRECHLVAYQNFKIFPIHIPS